MKQSVKQMGGRPKLKKGVLKRLIKMLFRYYPVLIPLTIFFTIFNAVASAIPALFLQKVTDLITKWQATGS